MSVSFGNAPQTSKVIGTLSADFDGLQKLDDIINAVVKKMLLSDEAKSKRVDVNERRMTMDQFDGWFAPLVRAELGKTLAIMRNKAVSAARRAGAGSASTAVRRRMYKNRWGGNINIYSGKRISSKKRRYEAGHQRTVSQRTRELNEYYGPDRAFILQFLEFGTDERTVEPSGPAGRHSKASWGRRGNITPRSFFHLLGADMEEAANRMGRTLTDHVEKFIQKELNKEY